MLPNYPIPLAVAGLAIVASGLMGANDASRRRRRLRRKIAAGADGQYVLGLVNVGNTSFLNATLQGKKCLASLSTMRSYLAERIEPTEVPSKRSQAVEDFVIESVAFALFRVIEALNTPLSEPHAFMPRELLKAIESQAHVPLLGQHTHSSSSHLLGGHGHEESITEPFSFFEVLSDLLTSEEEMQYLESPAPLLDANTVRGMLAVPNPVTPPHEPTDGVSESSITSSLHTINTISTMWSSISTVGGYKRPRLIRTHNPFKGLLAAKRSCLKCGYTTAIQHYAFDTITIYPNWAGNQTLEECLADFTHVTTNAGFECRRCALVSTLQVLTKQKRDASEQDAHALSEKIGRIEDALHRDVEKMLPGVTLLPSSPAPPAKKHVMFAKLPRALCIHVSTASEAPRWLSNDSHREFTQISPRLKFAEHVDLAPFTTTGYLSGHGPEVAIKPAGPTAHVRSRCGRIHTTSVVRSGDQGLALALPPPDSKLYYTKISEEKLRPMLYRLQSVLTLDTERSRRRYIAFRRKRLPTGNSIPSMASVHTPSKFWKICDDIVEEVDLEIVLASQPCMLFYEREILLLSLMSDRYSFSLTTFSPSGKLVQIEYALNAVGSGVTSIGIKATNGIVIATEKKSSSPLVDDSSIEKVAVICANVGMVYSGMGPDFRVLVNKARKSAQAYKRIHMEDPPVRILVQDVASVMQEFTQSGGVRPFGVSLLIAGYDDIAGPSLYQVDPSGSYWAWKATAMGKNMVNAKTFLEKRYNEDIELEDAVHTAILTLKEGFEGQMTENSIEIGIIGTSTMGISGNDRKEKPLFRRLNATEVRDYLANIA
ncbi:hypothetical protein BZG36_03302 [Bifiguratus adelaidae]|uniref:USP domain-containing protein n=1 Tax=Bifiguratus adelaidae TaxID=1938954 RepID=A0A261XZB7_9FUNG|nr:hypothetical protein BZG36_03302 [Bifiguratus adelaidae]